MSKVSREIEVGWGFPANSTFDSHFFVDSHAVCNEYLVYVGPVEWWPTNPYSRRCSECELALVKAYI